MEKNYSLDSMDRALRKMDEAFDVVKCMDKRVYPLPNYMRDGVFKYLMHGIAPGDFLMAVFSNSLKGAAACADASNKERLWEWANFLYNNMPQDAQGSFEKVAEWIRRGGLIGKVEVEVEVDNEAT